MAYRRSLDFLPSVFRTEVNDKFLHATVDQLISEPELRRIDGYVGRKFSPVAGTNDSFINELTTLRQNYQLEPHTVFIDNKEHVKFTSGYVDLLRRIDALGGFTNNHSRLFSDYTYNYDGFIDFDKFLNYSSYYWLPNGPDSVTVYSTDIPLEQDFTVTPPILYQVINGKFDSESFETLSYDVSESAISRVRQDGIKFDVTGTKINPTIRLARGGVYNFIVDQIGHGFYIQTTPGTTDTLAWQQNLSSRDVFGVENNGEDVGVITFKVPTVDAQDFFLRMPLFESANLVAHSSSRNRALRYSEVHYRKYNDIIATHGGIDGQRMLEGKTIVFLKDPASGKNPQPWQEFTKFYEGDLVQYANTVYRVLQDFQTTDIFSDYYLELYDLQQSWYKPEMFDSVDTVFDANGFDIGTTVEYENRRGKFIININADGYIVLTPNNVVPRNNKVKILEGIAYGNKEIYRNSNDDMLPMPATTASLSKLYYTDSLDPNIGGVIEIVDQDNNLKVDVLGSILGKTSYTSPNGVQFTNGLKVKFLNDVVQPEYRSKTYYIEGVGKSIELVDESTLLANEPWLETIESPFDATYFDSEKFSSSTNSPIYPDYFVINRRSLEKSAWSRQNRWFHKDVVELTSQYNNYATIVSSSQRAKRPILEFDPNLQLFNFGQISKTAVDVIDTTTRDALSIVEGQIVVTNNENVVYFTGSVDAVAEFKASKESEGYTLVKEVTLADGIVNVKMKIKGVGGYYVDDIPLTPGMRVIFTADTDPDVRNKIYEVQYISPQSETEDRAWSFVADGSTLSYDLNYNVDKPNALKVFINGLDASSNGYYWSFVSATQELTFTNIVPPEDANISVSLTYDKQLHLVLAADGNTVTEGDCVYAKQGLVNQGKMFHFIDGTWKLTQQKTKLNQPPKFDVYDQDKVSFGNSAYYASSSFDGSKLFGYETGTGAIDTVLGMKLKYRNINNIGDIVFSDFITKGSFVYRIGQQSITKSTIGGKVKENNKDRSFVFRNQWRKIREKSRQLQLQTFFANEYEKNLFKLNVLPNGIRELAFTNIIVYVNNNLLYNNHYDLQIEDNNAYLLIDKDLNVGDKLDIKVYSSDVNDNSVFDVPANFTNNPFNNEISDVTLGQMRTHILRSIEDVPDLSDEPLSRYNLRDTQDVKTFRGSILQHAGSSHLANFFLNDSEANFVNSTINAQREYVRYKNRIIQLANELAVQGESPSETFERVMTEIVANKNKNFAYFTSDMLPFGNDFNVQTYTVRDTRLDTYDLSQIFNPTVPSEKAVLVYINGTQLLKDRDYTFSLDRPILLLNLEQITLNENDVIEIREYISTDGSYIPPTPTKLGLYPLHVPAIIQDGYDENIRQLLKGHDGSLTALYGDNRDSVLLEFETRIYNNIKATYNTKRFDIWNYIPGAFRTTDYTNDEFTSILSSHFSAWSGSNGIAVSDYRQFVANDAFTYNYGRFTNRVDGKLMPASNWRGLYRYYYDTDAPHLRPWEMLGFNEKPTWWEINYGPAPYTSGNTVLWDDLEAGRILAGDRAGTDARFARPGLKAIIPVDENGELLSPLACLSKDINELDVSGFFKFGDVGPVELAWRQSSEYPFVLQIATAIMKPAEYFGANIDTTRQIIDLTDEQEYFADSGIREISNQLVQNEIDENGNIYRVNSYTTYISEYCKSKGLDVTKTLGNKLRNLQSKLGYKVGGYTDKKYLKVITDQYSPASNNPGIIIPDDDFDIVLNKSAPVYNLTYSGVIVTKTVDGYSVTGYDDNKPYFTIESSAVNENTSYIKVGKLAVIKYHNGTNEFYRVPYGTEFYSIDQVADFLISYGRYLTRQGFQFTNKVDADASWYLDWDLSVREFLFYVQQGWEVDIAISLSPVGNDINYRSSFGIVDGLNNRPLSTRILDEDFKIVRNSEYTVNRNARDFSATVDDARGIYLLDIDVVEYEHVLLFNNKTRFNDIIYDPVIGDRQNRLRLQGFKTGDWDGTYSASGFIINEDNIEEWRPGVNYNKGDIVIFKDEYFTAGDKIAAATEFDFDQWIKTEYSMIKTGLLPNLANRAGLFKKYYDTNEVNLEQDAQKLSKNLIGFEPRSYMEDLGISDTSQFKFYQGMLSQKGTNSSLDKLLKAKVDNFGGYANVYEEWALRVGSYGATDSTRNLQIELDETWAVKDPLVVELLNDNDPMPIGYKGLRSKDIFIKHVPYDKNYLNNRISNNQKTDLYTAGYAQLSDVDYTSPTRDTLNSYVQDKDVGAGDLIWIAADLNNQWNIYRIDETDIRLESANIISNGNATIRCVNNHNLIKNDLIYINADNTNPSFVGFFSVLSIIDARTFVISTGFGNVQITPFSGFVYKLKSMRFDSVKDVSKQEPLKGWKTGDKLFIDQATDDGWQIYENRKVWDIGANFKSKFSEAGDSLGSSIATDTRNYYMISGKPGYFEGQGGVTIYSIKSTGTLEEIATLSTNSVGTAEVGHSVTVSNDSIFAAGAPMSDDIGFAVIFMPSLTGEIRTQQVIASDTLDANGEFGYSVKLSNDGNWLAIGQPGTDEGYVYLYQRKIVSILPSATDILYGDGSSNIFALTGDLANPRNTESVEVTQDGVLLLPTIDYTVSGSDLILVATPVYRSRLVVTVNRNTAEQTFIGDGSTVDYILTGDNASPSSIYALYVEVNGVIQVPYRDYTLTQVLGNNVVILTTAPDVGTEINISQRSHFELITSFTDSAANIGDRFGQTLAFTDDARQLVVGAPNTGFLSDDGSTIINAGKVYVYDRTFETFYADGIELAFTTDTNIIGTPFVYVDNKRMVENVDYARSGDTITFVDSPLPGSLVKISTNNFVLTSELTLDTANEYQEENARFGESIIVCPANCSVYVGAPGYDGVKTNSGRVYRFVNQGRFFGNITGTVQDPVISATSSMIINDFIVNLSNGDNIDDIVLAINDKVIPGVTAYNNDGYLYIETNSLITGEKLIISAIDGQPLVDIGLEIYPYQQTIDSPEDEFYVEFGRTLAIGPNADLLAVGSSRASIRLETSIDNKTTYFDARATAFNDIKKQSGAAWLYQYIPIANSSVDNPGQFISAQRLINPMVDKLDEYGTGIAINQNTIYVGAPGDDTDVNNGGIVFSFTNNTNEKTWSTVRKEEDKVDINLINRVFLYNRLTNDIVTNIDYIDPVKGKISGLAAQEITYQTSFDPAVYNNDSSGRVWGNEHVGQVWWDISQTRWINYEQGDIGNRGINWNTAFPGSTIICYEWIESDLPPSQFIDEKDPSAFVRSNKYNIVSNIDANSGVIVNKYYYWVAGKRTIPTGNNRKYSTVEIENFIANPRGTGVPFAAFLSSNAIALYNVSNLLQDTNIVLNIDYDVVYNENSIHSEYQLLAQNDENSVPHPQVVQKLIDSLAGTDTLGNLVPDIKLTPGEKYGIEYRPRQAMFRDRKTALKSAVHYVNRVLSTIPARDTKDTSNLLAYEEIPSVYTNTYDDTVNDNVELSYLDISLFPDNYRVLVKTDHDISDKWAIYQKINNQWKLTRVQTFDNRHYIQTVDWVKSGIEDPIVANYTVDLNYQVASITPQVGDTVKVRDSGNGRYSFLRYTENNTYEIIKQEAATYKILDAIYEQSIYLQGFDVETYDVQIFDDWPTVEIQKIMRAAFDDIFTNQEKIEKNRWFLLLMNHLLAEQEYVDWLFKTSFIKVEHRDQQAISQIASLQKDRQDNLRQYIEEIKPYHTKIREFINSHEGIDYSHSSTTDFDLPAYYSEATGKYRSPTGLDEIDDIIFDRPEYQAWRDNHTLELDSVVIYNTGSGYTDPPVLTLQGISGSNTKLESVIVNGEITSVVITNPDTGAITTPTIEIGQSSGIDGMLIPIMKNSKVRSIKDVIKFDRISNNGGFLITFLDSYGTPIDIRNQRKSRLQALAGVIDELLDALSLDVNGYTHWIKDSTSEFSWPVPNVNNYRIFNDDSGRIQVQYNKIPGGWTAPYLETYLRLLGASVGVDELDITGTTVVADGNMSIYAPTVMEWRPNTRYDRGDIIVYNNKAYTLRDAVPFITTGDEIDLTIDFREYTANEFESHLNRTWAYYQPIAGLPGKDLGQLYTGIEYPGVKVQGASFRAEPGFDVGNYSMDSFDQYILGDEGIAILDDKVLDQTLYSNFLDTSLGTRPEDIITSGGAFVDTYSSHAPEETIPGRVYDTLNITVHTLSTTFTNKVSGFSPQFTVNKYNSDGVTKRFKFRQSDQTHLGDYFLVYSNTYGPLYRKISETNFSGPTSIVDGGFYKISQERAYSVDWVNEQLVFDNPLPVGDLITIINIAQIGENILADDNYLADGTTAAFRFNVSASQLGGVLVLINGMPTDKFSIENIDGAPYVILFSAPAAGSHVHLVATLTTDFAISYVNTQYAQIDDTTRTLTLNREIRNDRSKDTVMIVELNGQRLRPGNSTYYTGDGSTLAYAMPSSADEDYSYFSGIVEVWINGYKVNSSYYNITPYDGSSVPQLIFTVAPKDGDDISITYTGNAEYTYTESTQKLTVSAGVDVPDGSILAVTAFSHHDAYKFKTKIFKGVDYSTATVNIDIGFGVGEFDVLDFDTSVALTKAIGQRYQIDADQNEADKVFISIDGHTLIAEYDYTVTNGTIFLSDALLVKSDSIIIVTWMSVNQYINSTTFRVFKDLNDNYSYNRIAFADSTLLTKPLAITDAEIYVSNAKVLGDPNVDKNIPGVIFIGGERITFWQKNGNVLSQIRRGTAGTAAQELYAKNSIVVDASNKSAVPNGDLGTWYDLGDNTPSNGEGIALSDTVQARFLKESKGIIPFLSVIQIGGYILPGYVLDQYFN